MLTFFSRPQWTYRESRQANFDDSDMYPQVRLPFVHAEVSATIAVVLLAVVTVGLLLEMRYVSQNVRVDGLMAMHGREDYWRGISTTASSPIHVMSTATESGEEAQDGGGSSKTTPSRKQVMLHWLVYYAKRPFQTQYFRNMSVKRMWRVLLILVNIFEIGCTLAYWDSKGHGLYDSYYAHPSAWLCVIFVLWFDYRSAANLRALVSVIPRYFMRHTVDCG